ncbi:hypothetical protein [Aminobacter carboxidus]|uniref:Uncharacterized protein n=1 Tax=Aminobacter carboxidus TaxID=376165 RepID=A0ABR9GVX6_9HYPH|nr:hypothetical protein [Aminobacter carboxidus]MBE1207821.1 hypothetical protein [Aminobacter carboxidus]
MTRTTISSALRPLQTWLRLLVTSTRRGRRRGRFDPRDVSAHLNRDLGYLDGKEPAGSVR